MTVPCHPDICGQKSSICQSWNHVLPYRQEAAGEAEQPYIQQLYSQYGTIKGSQLFV